MKAYNSLTSFLLTFVISVNVFASTMQTTSAAQTRATAKVVFQERQLKMLHDEYAEWKFRELTLHSVAGAKGLTQLITYSHIPSVVLATGSVFFVTWKSIWKSLVFGQKSCGCYFFEFVGATLGATIAAVTTAYVVHNVRLVFEEWVQAKYAKYYGHVNALDEAGLVEESLNIQAALRDLEDKIIQSEKNMAAATAAVEKG